MKRNVIYCRSVFPPRFPDLRWPHCTPYRVYKKFFPIFLALFVPPLQTYEVMLPRSKLMCSLFLLFTFTTIAVCWGISNNIQLSYEWFGRNLCFKSCSRKEFYIDISHVSKVLGNTQNNRIDEWINLESISQLLSKIIWDSSS